MLHEGLALGHARANDAAARAGAEWMASAMEAFKRYAINNKYFTTEQVRMANPDLPEPPDRRAWGAVPRVAKKEGFVRAHGWTRADSRTVHGMVVTMWESGIYQGESNERTDTTQEDQSGGQLVQRGDRRSDA
jgi:hypothetical protein